VICDGTAKIRWLAFEFVKRQFTYLIGRDPAWTFARAAFIRKLKINHSELGG
jgi:hypothetical protein